MKNYDYRERVRNRILYFYILSMASILVVSSLMYFFSNSIITRSAGIANVINIAGSQRMLSQRIVLYLTLYDQYEEEGYRFTVEQALEQLSSQHESLTNPPGPLNLPSNNTKRLAILYSDRGLDSRVKRFLAVARRALKTQDFEERKRLIRGLSIEVQNRLLNELDEAVHYYVDQTKKKNQDLRIVVNAFLASMFIAFFVNIIMVYRPVANEVSKLIDALQRMTLTDPMTNLLNRRGIYKVLNELQKMFDRYQRPYSVCLIDIDKFKYINDTYGHDAGDHILKQFSNIAHRELRKNDKLGRYGGEEFLGAFPETSLNECYSISEKLREKLESTVIDFKSEKIKVTISIGCATARKGDDIESLIKKADVNVYKAKTNGRNRVIFET